MTNENLLKKTKFIVLKSVKDKSVSCYFLFGDEIRFYILDNFIRIFDLDVDMKTKTKL